MVCIQDLTVCWEKLHQARPKKLPMCLEVRGCNTQCWDEPSRTLSPALDTGVQVSSLWWGLPGQHAEQMACTHQKGSWAYDCAHGAAGWHLHPSGLAVFMGQKVPLWLFLQKNEQKSWGRWLELFAQEARRWDFIPSFAWKGPNAHKLGGVDWMWAVAHVGLPDSQLRSPAS